jgi:hypothetical protein
MAGRQNNARLLLFVPEISLVPRETRDRQFTRSSRVSKSACCSKKLAQRLIRAQRMRSSASRNCEAPHHA